MKTTITAICSTIAVTHVPEDGRPRLIPITLAAFAPPDATIDVETDGDTVVGLRLCGVTYVLPKGGLHPVQPFVPNSVEEHEAIQTAMDACCEA